jgi:hypothetical protein
MPNYEDVQNEECFYRKGHKENTQRTQSEEIQY